MRVIQTVLDVMKVNGFVNYTESHFLNSSSTAMHKEPLNIVKALILTCIQLVVFAKITEYSIHF